MRMVRNIFKMLLPATAVWLALSAEGPAALAQSAGVQTQAELQSRIAQHKPATQRFVKARPVVGWVLTGERIEDVPQSIRSALGDVDQTKYDRAYLAKNKGSIIALQMDGDTPDFYIIGKTTFETTYEPVAREDALKQNPALTDWLAAQPELSKKVAAEKDAIVGARKSKRVEMMKLSALGYKPAMPVTIQSPWGEQSKPAGQDAYLAHDGSSGQYYLINQDENGNPLSYEPAH